MSLKIYTKTGDLGTTSLIGLFGYTSAALVHTKYPVVSRNKIVRKINIFISLSRPKYFHDRHISDTPIISKLQIRSYPLRTQAEDA
mgnify:CR=1 FL=1